MLTMRGVQGAGGAVAIATAAAMLRADERRDAAWSTIAIAGAAAGPALGGALTQAFDWHAIFVAQVPIALAAAAGCALAAESHSLDAPAATARPEPHGARRSSPWRSCPPRSPRRRSSWSSS